MNREGVSGEDDLPHDEERVIYDTLAAPPTDDLGLRNLVLANA
jgi:hypothetical protein